MSNDFGDCFFLSHNLTPKMYLRYAHTPIVKDYEKKCCHFLINFNLFQR